MRRILTTMLLAVLLTGGAQAAHATSRSGSADDAPPVARKSATALFFGDSYFVGGGCSPDRTRDMAYLAGVQLGYRPVVRGAGGTGFVGSNPAYDAPDYLTQIDQGALRVRDPKLVVIEGGSNDTGFPVARIKKNARKVLSIADRLYPDARLVLMGPIQTYGDYSETDAIKVGLRQVARSMGVPFINAQKWTAGHDEWLCSDYVHPTPEGQVQLGARLAEALAKRGA
jgi:acyl-CoA thioesterase-1